jgi:hypothetical protein
MFEICNGPSEMALRSCMSASIHGWLGWLQVASWHHLVLWPIPSLMQCRVVRAHLSLSLSLDFWDCGPLQGGVGIFISTLSLLHFCMFHYTWFEHKCKSQTWHWGPENPTISLVLVFSAFGTNDAWPKKRNENNGE